MDKLPSWVDTDELPSILCIKVTNDNLEDILDLVSTASNIELLHDHAVREHKYAQFAIDFENALTPKEIMRANAQILSSLSSLVVELRMNPRRIRGDTDTHIVTAHSLFDQIMLNIQSGKLRKIKPLTVPLGVGLDESDHLRRLMLFYSKLMNMNMNNDGMLSITFDVDDEWMEHQRECSIFRNALSRSTNLRECAFDLDFHLFKEQEFVLFICGLLDSINSNESISSMRWQCINLNSKNITDFDKDQFLKNMENKWWPKYIECITQKPISKNNGIHIELIVDTLRST